ncbi:MBL fold metallo-hydrolase [Bordetella genomosp. 9]|uniref:MBL fold metallo-hydrolase n=1 Tax=Bordetella genomosp. 9 TaxID=1416803 RepID=A0A261RFK9_9BORD|nr:MBL fold metallo-hydrolase [Bordetella genomosp. 9]OZI23814.1 MBL fold metallo-hydrolase [Bordetella genomosp. 9]
MKTIPPSTRRERVASALKLAVLAAALSLAGLQAPAWAQAAPQDAGKASATVPPQVRTQAPGFYRMMLGQFEVTAISDGTIAIPLDKLLQTPPEQTQADLARAHRSEPVETSINTFLIHTGTHLVLVDTGAGDFFGGRGGGQLLRNIKAAGYDAADIDRVLLTHIHGDHSGGLTVKGRMLFLNADVYVDKHDADYWLDPANAAKAPEKDRHVFEQARQSLDPYAQAGRLKPFASGARILPGIRAIPQPGHTPGHTRYLVESDGHRLELWGDIVHAEEVQFSRPNVTIQFDVVAAEAARARKQAFDEAARDGYLVGGAHIPFPGLGHVQRDGQGYRWLPVAYSLDGLKP